jgi:hypothetical protein
MKTYNYFYYGQAITRSEFINNVPENWEENIKNFNEYSYGGYNYGGYRAIEIEIE